MHRFNLFCISLSFGLCQPALADYSNQVQFSYDTIKTSPSEKKITTATIDAVFNLEPISTADGPLAEASFLYPSNRISVIYDRTKGESSQSNVTHKTTLLGGVVVNSKKNLEFGVSLGKTDINISGNPLSFSADDQLLALAYHFKKGMAFRYTQISKTYNDASVESDKEIEDIFTYRQLMALGAEKHIAIQFDHRKQDNSYKFGIASKKYSHNILGGTYYISRDSGISLEFSKSKSEAESSSGTAIAFAFETFISTMANVNIFYGKIMDSSPADEDAKIFGLALGWRFQ